MAGGQGESPAAEPSTVEDDHGNDDNRGADDHDHDHDGVPAVEPVALESGERLQVVATTNIVGDVVRNIIGDRADLTVLIPQGQNPHGYTPAPRAVAAIERAHVVFVNGFDLEENLLDTVQTAATGYIVPVSSGIEAAGDHDHDHGEDDHDHGEDDHDHAAGDPHVWFDPNHVMVWVNNIEHTMIGLLPEESGAFEAAAERYQEQLQELDAEIRRRVASLPESRRKIVIDHASLDYFADRYGFEVIGTVIPATTDQAEPSAQAVARLVEVIRQEDVPAIFVGATASQGLEGLVSAVANEVGGAISAGSLLTGSLAPEGEVGDTYLTFMEYNVTQIVENLAD
jgi:ABC-type Zn uptake system ZnuABC Zn-binding protein ZnuA